MRAKIQDLLVGDEDLEGGDEVSHGDRLVGLPLIEGLHVVNKDEEVVFLALVVSLVLDSLAASHCDCGYGERVSGCLF